MSKITYLNQHIKNGDIRTVAGIVGCHEDTVKRILKEDDHPLKRSHETELGKKVIAALEEVINLRFTLRKKYQERKITAA